MLVSPTPHVLPLPGDGLTDPANRLGELGEPTPQTYRFPAHPEATTDLCARHDLHDPVS